MTRPGQRQPKNRRVERPPVEPAPASRPSDRRKTRKVAIRQRVPIAKRAKSAPEDEDVKATTDEIERSLLGFCCQVCHCPSDKEDYMPQGRNGQVHRYVRSGDGGLYHRTCCHDLRKVDNEWSSLYEAAVNLIGDPDSEKTLSANQKFEWVTYKEIYECYMTAKRQESALYNADGDCHPLDRLRTNQDYVTRVDKPYKDLCQKVESRDVSNRRRVVILDAFAGIGTGIVAMKRLGIDIAKVIHIEHDKVATHVHRWNHDHEYNSALLDEGIEHVFVEKWERLEANWRAVCETHGPIDVILGGPPCVDYSKVNANRRGFEGEQGQYMLRFGNLIREIERYQDPHPLFFLAENVVLTGDDCTQVRDAFGLDWDPIALDAQYFSPTRRNRHFLTNIPLLNVDFTNDAITKGPSSCLEVGFVVPAHFVDPGVPAKAQCLMASKSRIDERQTLRMFVFKIDPDDDTVQEECNRNDMETNFEEESNDADNGGNVKIEPDVADTKATVEEEASCDDIDTDFEEEFAEADNGVKIKVECDATDTNDTLVEKSSETDAGGRIAMGRESADPHDSVENKSGEGGKGGRINSERDAADIDNTIDEQHGEVDSGCLIESKAVDKENKAIIIDVADDTIKKELDKEDEYDDEKVSDEDKHEEAVESDEEDFNGAEDADEEKEFVDAEEPDNEAKQTKKYYGRPMETIEREKLMGYPVGYVQEPVDDLFTSLVRDAHSHTIILQPHWKETLPSKYHTFAGNYHNLPCKNPHRFDLQSMDPPTISLNLAPPVHLDQEPSFFNAEEYAKHLIGMAYSVPVAEILLAPLQKLYRTKEYSKYGYSYAWESPSADV